MERPILLIVDADADVRAVLVESLHARFGSAFRAMDAPSGGAALESMREAERVGRPVALLMARDRLPDMDGMEFLRLAGQVYPNTKRILYSGDAEGSASVGDRTTRVDSFLVKPWLSVDTTLEPVCEELLPDWEAGSMRPDEGVKVIGFQWSAAAHEAKDFLARNRVPYVWLDVERHPDARRLLDRTGVEWDRLPLLVFPDGSQLLEPDDAAIAEKIGLSTTVTSLFYDLVVVGGGPAGLAAGMYGSSEGLRTIIIDRDAPGGQAGHSTRIENYLGFPDGLSGAELAQRAIRQAKRFGVEILAAREVKAVYQEDPFRIVRLDDGQEIVSHAVLLAMGVSWRLLDAQGCLELHGTGVYYGAASAEAPSFKDQDVYVVGGGNSAGQAVAHLARYARSVTMLVLEGAIEERMSLYLAERIQSLPNVTVRARSTVIEAHGSGRLERITIRNVETGDTDEVLGNALFVFIGAAPETHWLDDVVTRDEEGYILCGAALGRHGQGDAWPLRRDPYLLETSVPGIFVAGDVRADSVKRIASAVGEGSMAVHFIHAYLRDR